MGFRLDSNLADSLAREFGTPLYVLSEAALIERIQAFRSALSLLPNPTRMSFASKANSTLAVLQIAYANGCHIDVASEGELRAAMRAGVSPADCTLHGNNKSVDEIAFAFDQGIGEIVVDSFDEIHRLGMLGASQRPPSVTLRVNPQLDLNLNPKIATATTFTKFGFPLTQEDLASAIEKLDKIGLPVTGLHCHLGSQIFQKDAHARAAHSMTAVMNMLPQAEWQLLNLGGGFGIRYTNEEPPTFADCLQNIKAPEELTIAFEPGRSLVGESGVTLYRVGTIKNVNGVRVIAVDGGLADNPRPAMYDAQYTVKAFKEGELQPATIVGRHCENDVLHPHVSLPSNLEVGDLIQVLATGAYSSSMASNYNRYPRPATAMIRGDLGVLVQRRESFEAMLEREVLIDGL